MGILEMIIILLILGWIIGLIFKIGGKIIHIVLVVAAILLIARLLGIGV